MNYLNFQILFTFSIWDLTGAGLRGQKKGKRPPATIWGKLFVKSSSVFAGLFQYIYFCVGVGGRWGPWRGVENALLRSDWNRWTLIKINSKILLLLIHSCDDNDHNIDSTKFHWIMMTVMRMMMMILMLVIMMIYI